VVLRGGVRRCERTEQVLRDEHERLRGLELSANQPRYTCDVHCNLHARHVEDPVKLAGSDLDHAVLRVSLAHCGAAAQ